MQTNDSITGTEGRLRIWYSKCDDLRFLGHRDLLRTFERWLRRAGLELQFSQGFHPRALMHFPAALAVGIAGEREFMELWLVNPPLMTEIESRLRAMACPGLHLLELEGLPATGKSTRIGAAHYAIDVPDHRAEEAARSVSQFLAAPSWFVPRRAPSRPFDARSGTIELELTSQNFLRMKLVVDQSGSVRPREVLQALGLDDLERQGAVLRRVTVVIAHPPAPRLTPTTATVQES